MGLLLKESSPTSSLAKCWPQRIPDKSLIVVPEFPQSRGAAGALSPLRPLPFTCSDVPAWLTSMPRFRIQLRVLNGSAADGNDSMELVPSAILLMRRARWARDLSPGTEIVPFRLREVVIFRSINEKSSTPSILV